MKNYKEIKLSVKKCKANTFGKDDNNFYNVILIQNKIDIFTYSIRSIVLAT